MAWNYRVQKVGIKQKKIGSFCTEPKQCLYCKAWLLRRNNSIAGFALGRVGSRYHHLGPVAATNTNDARTLIGKALMQLIHRPVLVDAPSGKQDLINWLKTIGFTRQREFVRMFRKENPIPGSTNKQYLICGPEFG